MIDLALHRQLIDYGDGWGHPVKAGETTETTPKDSLGQQPRSVGTTPSNSADGGPGVLDLFVAIEEHGVAGNAAAVRAADTLATMTTLMDEKTALIGNLGQPSAPGYQKRLAGLANEAANVIDHAASKLEPDVRAFSDHLDGIFACMADAIPLLRSMEYKNYSDAEAGYVGCDEIMTAMHGFERSMSGMAQSVRAFPPMTFSLNRARRRFLAVVDALLERLPSQRSVAIAIRAGLLALLREPALEYLSGAGEYIREVTSQIVGTVRSATLQPVFPPQPDDPPFRVHLEGVARIVSKTHDAADSYSGPARLIAWGAIPHAEREEHWIELARSFETLMDAAVTDARASFAV